jgi:cytochrome b subunit of formate dehydrogenase
MERSNWNWLIDAGLLVCFIVVGVSGLVLKFAFTSGQPGVGRTVSFLGTGKSAWLPWHNYAGLIMIALIVVHFVLHYRQFVAMGANFFRKKEEVVEKI